MATVRSNVFTSGSYIKIDGTEVGNLTGLNLDFNLDKVKNTTVTTAVGFNSYLPLRQDVNFTIEIYKDTGSADIALGIEKPVTASYSGYLYKGLATLYTKAPAGTLDGMIGQQYGGTFNGSVTEETASA